MELTGLTDRLVVRENEGGKESTVSLRFGAPAPRGMEVSRGAPGKEQGVGKEVLLSLPTEHPPGPALS